MLFFGKLTGLEEGMTVVKGKTNELLTAGDNFLITEGTGFGKGEMVVFGFFD